MLHVVPEAISLDPLAGGSLTVFAQGWHTTLTRVCFHIMLSTTQAPRKGACSAADQTAMTHQ